MNTIWLLLGHSFSGNWDQIAQRQQYIFALHYFRPKMTNRKKYISAIILLALPFFANAQLELYSKFNSDGSVEPVINYFGSKKINEKFSLTFFGLMREQWGQALIGFSYSPIHNLTLNGSAGIEHGQRVPRYSGSISFKKGNTSSLALLEVGAGQGNYLYKVNIFHEFSTQISLGLMDWRYHGLGPNFRYNIQKLHSAIWIMPAYDHEQRVGRCMLGATLQM